MVSHEPGGLHSALSCFCPVAHALLPTRQFTFLPPAVHRWVPSICQGQFKFPHLCEALPDCASQDSVLPVGYLPCLSDQCTDTVSSLRDCNSSRARNIFYIPFIPIISPCHPTHVYTWLIHIFYLLKGTYYTLIILILFK